MDNTRYWNLFVAEFNNNLNNDSELKKTFKQIVLKSNYDLVYLSLKYSEENDAPFEFMFNIGKLQPRLDVYFKAIEKSSGIYNFKKTRDAFLNEYEKKYPADEIKPFQDKEFSEPRKNSECRCTFEMNEQVTNDENGYEKGIKWQINKLKQVYKNVLNLNEEMLINCKYESEDKVASVLIGFKLWLKSVDKKVSGDSIGQYLATIRKYGKNASKYIKKRDVIELTSEDCEKIAENKNDIFVDVQDKDSHGTHFRKFGQYLYYLKNNIPNRRNVMMQKQDIIEILDKNKQVVLTGAPGTGKTFTVKEYVKNKTNEQEPGQHWMFVQFHPSYDYSDFVEGLKPVPESLKAHNNMFVRIDGCFKAFCRKAVMEEIGRIIGKSQLNDSSNEVMDEPTKKERELHDYENEGLDTINLAEILSEEKGDDIKQYYFVVDEINRADLSKVFGEIMYCLDEDYRGPKNAIQTQYSALKTYHNDGSKAFVPYNFDCFENGFFIPFNMHIIGTMNDIDRSVESFDFALRRRFVWKDVDANDSLDELTEMLSSVVDKEKVNNLIKIAKQINSLMSGETYRKLGLTKQFHLGKAYYKSFDGTMESIDAIFDNKIEPIIREYTRGRNPELVEKMIEEIANLLKSLENNHQVEKENTLLVTGNENISQEIQNANE